MPKFVNTFIGGLDRDTVPTSYGNKNYYNARNFSIVVAEDLSSATLTNDKGVTTKLTYDVSNASKKIVGFTKTSTSIVLFIQCPGTIGEIHEILFTALEVGSINLYGDTYLKIRNTFNFGNRVEAIAREETPLLRKIYWVDGQNPIRFCNLASDISGYSIIQFEINQDVTFSQPIYSKLISGNLKTGVYQYAYCLYNQNAGQTSYSPFSQFIQVSETGLTSSSTAFQGSAIGVETNSGIEISINDSNTNFGYIRVISIFYTTPTSVPEITIIFEGAKTSSLTVSHTGAQLLGTLVLEEAIANSIILIPKTIASKYNYLFVGNITEQDFDVDFDARTYRFDNSVTPKSRMYKDNSNYIDVLAGNYPSGDTDYNLSIKNRLDLDVSPTTGNALYKYQSNGSTIGGEGPNVSYTFATNDLKFRETPTGLGIWGVNESIGYSDPSQNDNVGYQRDEIYRFGIVFFNSKGQSSFVKWIGDIRMPHYSDSSNLYSLIVSSDYIRVLGITFTFNFTELLSNYPDVVSYQIVRAERTYDIATVVDCGYIGHLQKDGTYLYWGGWGNQVTISGVYPALHSSITSTHAPKSIVEYICSETNYNKNNDGGYERLDICGATITHTAKRTSSDTYSVDNVVLSSILPSSTFGAIINIDSTVLFRAQRLVSGVQSLPAIFGSYSLRTRSHIDANGSRGFKGTTLVFKLASDVSTTTVPSLTNDTPSYVLRRRTTYPYGGYSISAISNTIYYPCSLLQPIGNSSITVYGGDTYITKFEYMRTHWADGTGSTWDTDRFAQIVQCMVESKLNLDYTTNDKWSTFDDNIVSTANIANSGFTYMALWEKSGTWEFYVNGPNATKYYVQTKDLYTYNPVYSLSTGSKSYISKPINFTENTVYNTRVQVSEKKINGEVTDSWLQFLSNNIIDVDNQFGALTKLYNHNNLLFYFQPKGFGVVPVEDREIITTSTGASVSIGTGGVLKRYDYISTNAGTSLPNSIVGTDSNLYFIDDDLKKVCKLQNGSGFEFLSDTKGLYAYMNNTDLTSVNTMYSPKSKEIIFSFPTESLKYNEYTNSFISFSDTIFDFGVYEKGSAYIFKNTYGTYWYISGNTLGTGDYGVYSSDHKNTTKTPSSLQLIINPARQITTRLDLIELSTEVVDSGINIVDETFSTIRLENNYQDTGVINLISDDNIVRRFRTWRFNKIRNQNDDGRFIDNYSKLTLSFTNDGTTKMRVNDITTTFSPLNLR